MSIFSEIKKNKRVLFLDIDGVLADCTHRLKYIKGKKKDYDKFYGEVSKDTPLQEYDFITNLSEAYNGNVVFLTGRRQSCSRDILNGCVNTTAYQKTRLPSSAVKMATTVLHQSVRQKVLCNISSTSLVMVTKLRLVW